LKKDYIKDRAPASNQTVMFRTISGDGFFGAGRARASLTPKPSSRRRFWGKSEFFVDERAAAFSCPVKYVLSKRAQEIIDETVR